MTNPYLNVQFQEGPIPEVGVNGCTMEEVIDLLVHRLEGFQQTNTNCGENAQTIHLLQQAKICLQARTNRRIAAGIEGQKREEAVPLVTPAPVYDNPGANPPVPQEVKEKPKEEPKEEPKAPSEPLPEAPSPKKKGANSVRKSELLKG